MKITLILFKGDGGSPLVCPISGSRDRYVLSGLVSWGIKCKNEVPGAYADVSKARTWIDSIMQKYKFVVSYVPR